METNFSNGTEITSYLATAYAEGFCEGEDANMGDQLKAWSYLIGTKLAFSLQGCFGRRANVLISQGIISMAGVVDWELVSELTE
jgi:hypothetical protein